MSIDRRTFVKAGAITGLTLTDWLSATPFELDAATDLDLRLLPSVDEVWGWQTWMAKLGPKYTGNAAHRTFVEFLAKEFTALSLDVTRDRHALPMWAAQRTEITAHPAAGKSIDIPVASYYPYSGKTSDRGVSGDLLYVGTISALDRNFKWRLPNNAAGKIILVDFENPPMPYAEWWRALGFYTPDTTFPVAVNGTWTTRAPLLAEVKQAGALAVIFNQVSLSEEHAAYQYAPFGRAFQDLPALWVGASAGTRLKAIAAAGGSATVQLEAEITPDTPTDTLIATLPGASADETIIINTHTDGPNATEENGALGLLAIAKYFSRVPPSERKRTLVFVATTGHFAGAYVPGIRSVVEKHPDLIRKTVAAVTVEHLGCREWLDVASKYKATGRPELTLVITEFDATARVMLDAFKGSTDRRSAVVTPTPQGGFNGEGGALSRAGIPTIGYIPIPSYLLAGPPDGCIDRLDRQHLHGQIQVLTKVVRQIDGMSRADLARGGRMGTRATAG